MDGSVRYVRDPVAAAPTCDPGRDVRFAAHVS
jgi:hypothetical protein